MIKKIKPNYLYLIFLPIILNSLSNVISKDISIFLEKINIYDLVSLFLLFIFLYSFGEAIKTSLVLDTVSIGILIYLISFFLIDTFILFFYKFLSFNLLFIIVNLFWISLLIFRDKRYKKVIQIIFSYLSLNLYNNYFLDKITKNNNLIGDVEVYFYSQAKNIYEKSYYYSVTNFVDEGYGQFTSYIQALLLKISSNLSSFEFLAPTSQIIFLLSVLFFYELRVSKESKYTLIILFSLLILNSEWFQFLFTSSLMSEGIVSLFAAVIIYGAVGSNKKNKKINYIYFLLLGLLYFTKQFVSLLAILLVIIFFIKKDTRKFAVFGLYGVLLKEFLYLFVFKVASSHHIGQIDILDTIKDLLTNTDLKIKNILLILENLFLDKPLTLVIVILFFFYIFNLVIFKNIDYEKNIYFLTILLNFLFIFILYISAWRNMELESPIRYILNLFHLKLITIFLMLEDSKNKF